MSERDDDLARLATAMPGWRWSAEDHEYECPGERGMLRYIEVPAPDAPLPEAMAFVGRIAEELGMGVDCTFIGRPGGRVEFRPLGGGHDGCTGSHSADDLAWAAILAALEAKGGAT